MMMILVAALLIATPVFAADEGALKAVFGRLETCIAKADSACLDTLFADDATVLGPMTGAKLVKGKADIVKFIAGRLNARKVEQKYAVQNVRWIDEGNAIVDCSVTFEKGTSPEGMNSGAPREAWRSTALLTLKDGKWLLQDVRFYLFLVEAEKKA